MLVEFGIYSDGEFSEEVEEHSEQIEDMPLPEGTTGVDLVTPYPYFVGGGWYYDQEDHPYNQKASRTADESRHTILKRAAGLAVAFGR